MYCFTGFALIYQALVRPFHHGFQATPISSLFNVRNHYFCQMRKKKRQVFEQVTVIDAGAKGKAVAKAPDGRVIFLANAVPGDVVDVETYKKRKAYFEGTAIRFHHYSERRTEPVCEHFGTCGGCKWQHMDYDHQLYFKQKEVENNLRRIGGVELPEI